MKLEEVHMTAIAVKIMRMVSKNEDHLWMDHHANNVVFFEKKNRHLYFSINYYRGDRVALISVFQDEKKISDIKLTASFFNVDGFSLVSRLTDNSTFPPIQHLVLKNFVYVNNKTMEAIT